MLIQLTIPQWLQLSPEVRASLKQIFNIPRSSGTVLEDNKVVTDGYTHADLAHITVEKMQDYLEIGHMPSDEFYKLFVQVVAKIESSAPAHVPAQTSTAIHAVASEELFIEHNGKTYKLVEVPQVPQQPVVASAPQVQSDSGPITKAVAGRGRKGKAGKAK